MEVNKVGDIVVVSMLTRVDANSTKEVEKSMVELLIDGAKKEIPYLQSVMRLMKPLNNYHE